MSHEHAPEPSLVENIIEHCACGWWRWNPILEVMLAAIGHNMEWQEHGPAASPENQPPAPKEGSGA